MPPLIDHLLTPGMSMPKRGDSLATTVSRSGARDDVKLDRTTIRASLIART
jgi:hypothetical protein